MQVNVNGKTVDCSDNLSVDSFLSAQKIIPENIAVAINNRLVPKTEWKDRIISNNDKIIIIKAAQGG